MIESGTPTGVILTGGASRRMGSDKAFVVVGGRPMVVRVADAMREAGCRAVFCQGGDSDALAVLGFEVVPDPTPGSGPVLAIQAALERHGGPIVVAACDLADLDAATIRTLVDASVCRTSPLVAVATTEAGPQLLSVWSSDALAPLSTLVEQGVRAYRAALEGLAATSVPVDPAAVRNINYPEDLG